MATYKRKKKPNPEDIPLTTEEWQFVLAYINSEYGATKKDIATSTPKQLHGAGGYTKYTCRMLKKPNVVRKINELMEEKTKKAIAEANDVMEFFTRVMNGEERDQFGLDPSLADRIKAGQELAKRTVDVELRKQGLADNQVNININWGDPFSLPDMMQPQEPVGITFSDDEEDEYE